MKIINQKIYSDFKKGITSIFRENLLFGFLCGGIAKGLSTNKSDIDMFICLKKNIKNKEKKEFLDWYKKMHYNYGYKCDEKFPGEIMTIDVLNKTLTKTKHSLKNKNILDIDDANKPYGGFGYKANFISYGNIFYHRPILISKEIYLWLKMMNNDEG